MSPHTNAKSTPPAIENPRMAEDPAGLGNTKSDLGNVAKLV